ncbi:MAG: hypothetical protein JXK07_03035 [Spirochaetes bacterium]|nr:hypothetical protein [Spirochaetota bacterium]MBN2771061.1 hypothetical protein [Spirochaetota bacterium]
MSYKRDVIVVHGSGLLFHETLDKLIDLPQIEVCYSGGIYYFKSSDRLIIRRLLSFPRESKLITSYQKLLIAKMLKASLSPVTAPKGAFYEYNEEELHYFFGDFGLPFSYFERKFRTKLLEQRSLRELDRTLLKMEIMKLSLLDPEGVMLHEDEIRKKYSTDIEFSGIYELVNSIQVRYESGCSADSAFAAALTAYKLKHKKTNCKYGKDYVYGFVQYYEGLRSLEKFSPASLYINDIPPHVIPSFEDDLAYLKEKNVVLQEYNVQECRQGEDEMIKNLYHKGLIKKTNVFNHKRGLLSTESVMESFAKETIPIKKGTQTLLKILRSDGDRTSKEFDMIEELLGSPISIIEIIETVAKSVSTDSLIRSIRGKKWFTDIQKLNDYHASIEDKLLESVFELRCSVPYDNENYLFEKDFSILIAKSVKPGRKRPALTVGEAAFYYRRKFPQASYLLYCFGSGLIFFRWLKYRSVALNPFLLMSRIGIDGDGSETASPTCRARDNSLYPQQLLGNVSSHNFKRFVSYLTLLIRDKMGCKVILKNVSEQIDVLHKQRIMKVALFFIICLILGLSVLVTNEQYRFEKIEETNRDFYNKAPVSGDQ